jgi:hypothetical protein
MTEKHSDAELLTMVERHDHLWALCTPQACENGEANAFMDECLQLEMRIIATPVFTPEGLAGKQRVVEHAELDDDEAVVAAILRADAERIAAAG